MTGNWAIELEFLPALLIVAIQMAAVVHILVSKHENPSQAAFWLLLVTLLPGIGLLGYIFFGITHIEHVHNAILALRESWQYGDDASTKNLLKLQKLMHQKLKKLLKQKLQKLNKKLQII